MSEVKTVFYQNNTETDVWVRPDDLTKPVSGFPKVCISTFSKQIIDYYVSAQQSSVIAQLYTANGTNPVYKITYKGREMALYMSLVGAPACVCGLEEIIAMGAEKFVFFGCCGILDDAVVGNRLIVPTGAVRDEGTSYHYLPPSGEIPADAEVTSAMEDCLTQCGCPFVTGKIWTTDAIYRETKTLAAERKAAGCLGVDMEYASLLAAARFRKVRLAQFFYGADSLDNEEWQPRDLTEYGRGKESRYMMLALEAGLRL